MAKVRKSFTTVMVWVLVLSVVMVGVLYESAEQVNAADFSVATASEFQAALDAAENDGQDDTIYLAAGLYDGNFAYLPQDGMLLTIKGDPGTTAQDVNLNPMGSGGTVLYLGGSGANGSVTVEGLTIVNGSWSGLDIYCAEGNLDVTLRSVVIYDNAAGFDGGGIEVNAGIDATGEGNGVINVEVYDSVIAYNTASTRGGGIYAHSCYGNSSIDLLIVNSLIYGNQANWTGGGINLSACELGDNNETRAVIINSTITGNDSGADPEDVSWNLGGGIRVFAYSGNGAIVSLDLYNTIVYGNTSLGGLPGQNLYFGEWGLQECTVNAYNSDIGDWAAERGTPVYNEVNVLNADPAFINPGEEEYQLSAGSPCIDAGTTAVPDPPGLPATDIEGNYRNFGAAPDMGAYEWVEGGVPPPMVIDFSPKDLSFFATEGGANPASQTLEVWNSGAFTFDWTVSDDASWLNLSPPNGSSTGEHDAVTVSVNMSGMSAGSYYATITIAAPLAVNHPQTVPVDLTISLAGAGIVWNFPSISNVFLGPTPANNRPYLDAAVDLSTGTEPPELLGVYWLDEATGGWQYFIPAFGGGTLTSLEPGQAYLVAVSGTCDWNLPCGEGTALLTGNIWNFPSTSDVFLAPTPANNRPYLNTLVNLPTGTEPPELLGVYWLDEATGGWRYFIPAFGGGTLTSLGPGQTYFVAVSGACSWNI